MKQGVFLFIADDFFAKHDPDGCLMRNKEGIHDRPCFYAFPDKKEPSILWCVPISSRVEKYERIFESKIASQIEKGIKSPKCTTIRFGEVMGQKRAFLIQNMFPVAATYVSGIYMDRNSRTPVTIPQSTERDISKNARDVLKLAFFGHSNLVFSDVQRIYSDLVAELHADRQRKEIAVPANALAASPRRSFHELANEAGTEVDRRNGEKTAPVPTHEKQER